ncbi:sulfotransferase domain-containing protein [Candidatus Nitrosopelagicus sp.]|nr:sulfotransferase domain-containing protein [Candidatus Nitrosopelagicus sp.]
MNNNFRKLLSSKYNRFFKRGVSGITASTRVLPDFIIVGTVRSGTTSLYYNICDHPSILPADYDEIGFFDSNYHLGINWYRSMFSTQKEMNQVRKDTGYAMTGEDTPFYFWKEEAVKRISEHLPNVKIITIFRNPVDRAYSNYNLGVRAKTEKLTFEDAINEEIKFLEKHTFRETIDRRRSYLTKGIYEEQIKLWFDIFPREQIHILSTESMKQDPQNTLKKIFQFLEIPEYTIRNPQNKKSEKYEKMNIQTRKRLLEFYKPYNDKFFKIIEEKFEWND